MPGNDINIGKIIKDRRLEKGLTQREIANYVGVTEASVSRWESGGIGTMRNDKIADLAKILGISPLVLLGKEDDADPVPKRYGLQAVRQVMQSEGQDVCIVPRIGKIVCVAPILAEENLDGYEYIDASAKADFAIVARDDSMIDAGIRDGYIVFIRQAADVEDGEITAVLIGEDAMLRRVYHTDGVMVLSPANKDCKPMVITGKRGEPIRILGKAVALKGKL